MMPKHPVKRRYHVRFGGVMYVVVCGFIGVAAMQSQTNLLFWIFGLMLGGLVVSGLVSGAMLMGLRVHRLVPENGVVGEPLVLRYVVENRAASVPCFGLVVKELLPRQSVVPGVPEGWVLHVGPGEEVQTETVCWPRHRGVVQLSRVEVSTSFPFGILRKSVVASQPGNAIVLPRLYRLHPQLITAIRAHAPSGSRPGDQGGGDEEYFGLREYRPGDHLRLIHWKRTAKTGRLVTREMTRQRPERVTIVLDLRRRTDDWTQRAERAISLTASAVCEALLAGFEVGLLAVGAKMTPFEPQHHRWHRNHLLEALARLELDAEADQTVRLPLIRETNWLIVHAGPVDSVCGPDRAMHVSDAELERWAAAAAPSADASASPAANSTEGAAA